MTSGVEPRPPSARHRADIQGMRGIAVILVVAFHAGLGVRGGFVGVDVFFVISGFVIAQLLLGELDATGTIDLSRFYRRRVRRLLPALGLVTVVTLAVSALVLSPLGIQQTAATTGLAASGFVANAQLFSEPSGYFAAPAGLNPFLHTWTLAVEEQFYLAFPALLLLAAFVGRRHKRTVLRLIFAIVTVVALASFAAGAVLSSSSGPPFGLRDPAFAFYSSPTRGWEFAVGVLVALVAPRLARMPRPAVEALSVCGFGALVLSAFWISDSFAFPGTVAAVPVTAAALLIAAGCAPEPAWTSRVLVTPALTWAGDISYSWYLWHWPLIVFAHVLRPGDRVWTVAAASVSLLPAWASYRFVENPIRRDQRLVGRRVVALAAICVMVPALAAVSLRSASDTASAAVQTMRVELGPHLDESRGCTDNRPATTKTVRSCTWPADVSIGQRSVVLIGDSNAGQFAEAALPAAQAEGRPFTLVTRGACPFVRLRLYANAFDTQGCYSYVSDWLAALRSARPALVIVASASFDYFIKSQAWSFADARGDGRTSDVQQKLQLWTRGTRAAMRALTSAGIPVVLVHTLPHFVNWDPRFCSGWTMYRDTAACGRSTPLAQIAARQDPVDAAENVALRPLRRAEAESLWNAVCADRICRTNVGNRWLYKDGGHITVGEARKLEPYFARLIRRYARRQLAAAGSR